MLRGIDRDRRVDRFLAKIELLFEIFAEFHVAVKGRPILLRNPSSGPTLPLRQQSFHFRVHQTIARPSFSK